MIDLSVTTSHYRTVWGAVRWGPGCGVQSGRHATAPLWTAWTGALSTRRGDLGTEPPETWIATRGGRCMAV